MLGHLIDAMRSLLGGVETQAANIDVQVLGVVEPLLAATM